MSLAPGVRLGAYEVLALLGAGGMGEVYRARDTKLNRDVALKVLPEFFAHDSDRLARFKREAQVLASLNHPNIAAIYGLEESNGVPALVLELVEGPTLADRIAQGPLLIEDALLIARQIAEALEAAHEHAVAHRDLKPANIKVTPDGKVKVLDFGLAKMLEPEAASSSLSMSPTLSVHATYAGVILGTVAYMSPEQTRGKLVDRRTDVWAFGCVLYEMLTGQQPFRGETLTDIIASIVKGELDWKAVPASAPVIVLSLLRRCLEKDPNRRVHDIADVRIEIDEAITKPAGFALATTRRQTSPRLAWIVSAASVALVIATIIWAGFYNRPTLDAPSMRLSVVTGHRFETGFDPQQLALSPDGRRLTFVGSTAEGIPQLVLRDLDSLKAVPIAGTQGAFSPFWSPDSRFIGFFAEGKLKKIDVSGGPAQTLCELNTGLNGGGTWSRDGIILFSALNSGLQRVPDSGGVPSMVTELDSSRHEIFHTYPYFLPDGRHFLYLAWGAQVGKNAIYVGALDSKDRKLLITTNSRPVFASPRYILFAREATLMAQAFDPKRLELVGTAVPITEEVASNFFTGHASFSTADNGMLAYIGGGATNVSVQLSWYDRSGKRIEDVRTPEPYFGIDLSPDGKRIAVHRHEGSGGDIWLLELERGRNPRFTFDAARENSSPIWSPDGSQIAFSSIASDSWVLSRMISDGAGSEEVLMQSDKPAVPMAWSVDGQNLIYEVFESKTLADIWVLPLTDHKPHPLLNSKFWEMHPQVSPDGKWIAYGSDESGRPEVYVQPFPPAGAKWQISTNGGLFPRWRRDGRELFYMEATARGTIMAVDVGTDTSTLKAGSPKALFDSPYRDFPHGFNYHTYAVSPDGQRFLIPHPASADKAFQTETQPITIVTHWTAGLKK